MSSGSRKGSCMNKVESKYFHTAVRFNETLLKLLEKKPFAYITVSELCKEAGVNRSTFYLHYENTADLLKETTQYVMRSFHDYFSEDEQRIAGKFQDCDLQELVFINRRYLYPYLSYIRDHQRLFLAAVSQPMAFQFDAAFGRLFDRVFDPILDRFRYPDSGRKYVMMFYLNGITAIVMEWVRDGCRKDIDEIVEILHQCIFGAWDSKAIEGLLHKKDNIGADDGRN